MKCRKIVLIVLYIFMILALLCTSVYATNSSESQAEEINLLNSSADEDTNTNTDNDNSSNNAVDNDNTSEDNTTNEADDTVASGSLPLTGYKVFILPVIVISIAGLIFYKKYTEYNF